MELMNIVILTFILVSGTSGAPNRKSSSNLTPSDFQEIQHVRDNHGEALLDLAKGLEDFVLNRDELEEMEPSESQHATSDFYHQPARASHISAKVHPDPVHEATDDLNLHRVNKLMQEKDHSQDGLSREYEDY